ncbi:cbb3-type cytochrome c oxidase N-terminal domain-containing protein [Algoriphagus halophilus]|uniref:Cytochrome c oxidase cbb3-type subunit 3 n=1 Tax=Algoriphagus halophilus TaxID=226505 RepID=A0A1N6EQC1_9BACT|nr:cbb3-type cytochrome c oxidase N-terminal domain-containing protein [Algoriphagus halophilus]SIN85236.1 cytochrome c oxidase cbb3-type subunit 3 [Algoriphagus halophilus]
MKNILTLLFAFVGLSVTNAVFAQAVESSTYEKLMNMDGNQLTLLIIMGVILGVIVLLLILIIYLMSFITAVFRKENPAMAEEPTWWESFKEKFITGDVAEEAVEKKEMTDHSYDGITELDNFMPPWLQYTFLITAIFGIGYFLNYSVLGYGKTGVEEYEEELRIEAIASEERKANAAAGIDETTVVFDETASALASGKTIFEGNCAACHAIDGGGGVGPNLTDDYWIHGNSISDVFTVIKYGVVSKGMVPWEDQLSPEEIQQVASYILTLNGTSPANPKEPQGELVGGAPAAETPAESDSTAVE